MMKSWFKKVKCPGCGKKQKELRHELRLDTAEGVHSIFICDECSRFLDKSAEVLKRRRKNADSMGEETERKDPESDEEV